MRGRPSIQIPIRFLKSHRLKEASWARWAGRILVGQVGQEDTGGSRQPEEQMQVGPKPSVGSNQSHIDIVNHEITANQSQIDIVNHEITANTVPKHAIMKNRIDQNGHVIQVRMENIGTSKMGKPLQKHGGEVTLNETYCGSCYGAEMSQHECCNSCDDVREAYRRRGWGLMNPDSIDQCKREGFVQRIKAEEGEGCNLHGSLEVNKVAGNFHFVKSFHLANMHAHHESNAFGDDSYNISHRINKLSFGDPYPGILNPLDGVHWNQVTANGMYQYFIKVVPTVYTPIRGSVIRSNQFSVTEHYKGPEVGQRALPGVFFFYDLSAIKVTYTETHPSFLHFLTNLCAIVGGIFTVAGILDSFIYHGQRALKKKRDIGKLG
ncbi:endoplasmic reticulum-Golgi intermediate compartment protein 3-like protein [Tanacetum coccineum]